MILRGLLDLWRMSGRTPVLPGPPTDPRPERSHVTVRTRIAGAVGRLVWRTGYLMGRIGARITGYAEEPTTLRVATVSVTGIAGWVALCGLVRFAAGRWGR